MSRVVSLVPSVTETLLDWGITPIAVTRFCEHDELPNVGGTKDPDVRAIIDLQPDLVVMCDEENRLEDASRLADAGLALHVMRVRALSDVAPQLEALRMEVRLPPRTQSPLPAAAPEERTAFIPIWRQAGGGEVRYHTLNRDTYGSSLLAHLGVTNVFADLGDRYAEVEPGDVAARGPDLVIAPSEPYPFGERHRGELAELAPVTFVDGQDLFWWGIRTPAALTRLAETLRSAIRG